MKKILVIGGSGFVGSRLISEIEGSISNFDKNESPFFQEITTIGNVLDKPSLVNALQGVETVVLLAAEHRDDVSPTSLYYDVNVKGTQNVLDAMDNCGIKNLIFTSSVAVYGLNKVNPDENHPIDPFNHYGKSKWEAEKVINAWYEKSTQEKSITVIRPTVIFGERNRGNVYNLLKQIAGGKFLMIGKGENKKSMAYVGNVVAFIKNQIENKTAGLQIFNYVDKPDFNMNELVSVVQNKMNLKITNYKVPYWLGMLGGLGFDLLAIITRKKLAISSVRVKKFCATTQFDASKIDGVFKAPFSLENGLNRTLYHEFLNQKKDDILFYTE
jgi:nucleoside-diphosphate-sugar epimerase